jgi:predicted GNAT family acetyltransferase
MSNLTLRRRQRRIPLPGKKHLFIKIYADVDCGVVASVVIGMASWTECFATLAPKYPRDGDSVMAKANTLAVGNLYYDVKTESYYGSGTSVQTKFRGQGHGISLYKGLLMAAREHAKLRRRGAEVRFSPHQAVGSSTSLSAWRCYKSLANKGFLKLQESKNSSATRDDIFIAQRYPENIKPTVLVLGC